MAPCTFPKEDFRCIADMADMLVGRCGCCVFFWEDDCHWDAANVLRNPGLASVLEMVS